MVERADPLAFNEWLSYFSYNNNLYPILGGGYDSNKQEEPVNSFVGYVQAGYQQNGVVFACMLARLLLFAEARFAFRRIRAGRPGDLFGNEDLQLLETPWRNGTTGDLLNRMIQDADLAGNFYATVRPTGIRRMRPDWVSIILGSDTDPEAEGYDLDAEVIGYLYHPGGPASGEDPIPLMPESVCHYAPIPDPLACYRGMSWLTPIIRELMADNAATSHKLSYFENGATPGAAVVFDPQVQKEAAQRWMEMAEDRLVGVRNAYRFMSLGGGATDIKVIGANMDQISFKETQGAGETRIAAAAGVPPVIVGLSEGLQAATYSNYAQARRRFADGTMRPLWRNAAASLATLVTVPSDAELWYDDRDIPALREDEKDRAEIQQGQATAIKTLIDSGWEPDSARDAVLNDDYSRLVHSGLVSVQLQPPGTAESSQNGVPDAPLKELTSKVQEMVK